MILVLIIIVFTFGIMTGLELANRNIKRYFDSIDDLYDKKETGI